MKLFMALITLTLAATAQASTPDMWRETGNGGDSVAQDFVATAQKALGLLENAALPEIPLAKLQKAIQETQVVSQNKVTLTAPNGKAIERDAINQPPRLIIVSRERWNRPGFSESDKMALAVHEYLGIAGVERNSYAVSAKLKKLLQDPTTPVLLFNQRIDTQDSTGTTLSAAQKMCRDISGIYRKRYFVTYCTFETKQHIAIAPHAEYYKDYRYLGQIASGVSNSNAGGGMSVSGSSRGFLGLFKRNSFSVRGGFSSHSSSSYSEEPVFKSVVIPTTVYETLDRSLYAIKVWGIGDLKTLPFNVVESSLELQGGLLRHEFASQDEAMDSCLESLLILQSDLNSRGVYERVTCSVQKQDNYFYYVIRSQNPFFNEIQQ